MKVKSKKLIKTIFGILTILTPFINIAVDTWTKEQDTEELANRVADKIEERKKHEITGKTEK